MATVAQVRALLGDLPRFDRQTATGDGASRQFIVANYPIITGSDSITIDGTPTTAYTANPNTGVIAFTTAPALDAAIVILYEYAELADETITAILALQPNAYQAAAMCAENLAGRYANLVDRQVGDLRASYSQRAKQWLELAGRLRTSASRGSLALAVPYAGGISIADKLTQESNTDRVAPAFTRNLHDDPETARAVDDASF
jgi:hypothetical protein